MGYINGNSISIASSTDLNEYRSVAGRSTIEISPTSGTEAAVLGGSLAWYKVGALDGTVSVTPNHEVLKLQSSALQNPYAVIDTAYDFQVSFILQEVDLHNYALALGFSGSAVQDDSYASSGDISNGKLILKAGQGAAYRSLRIITQAATDSAATGYQALVFFKVRFQATGSFDFDRTAAVNIPITAHCLGTDADASGAIMSGVSLGTRSYG